MGGLERFKVELKLKIVFLRNQKPLLYDHLLVIIKVYFLPPK